MSWSEARVAELTRLWAAGVSASGIAEALGEVSRSAVLGKLHRLKLLGSRQTASSPRRYDGPPPKVARPAEAWARRPGVAEAAAAPPVPPPAPWREAAFAPILGTSPRPWLTREAGECGFPVGGDGEQTHSCCAPVQARSAYCAAHHRLVFKPVPPAAQAREERQWAIAAERFAA